MRIPLRTWASRRSSTPSGSRASSTPAHKIAHNKIILIDGQTIPTGSFNFTSAAEHSNAENLLAIHSRPGLYGAYERNSREHLAHSAPLGTLAAPR